MPDTVLDPVFGAATTRFVAARHGRPCVGIELNPHYLRLGQERMTADALEKSTPVRAAAQAMSPSSLVGAGRAAPRTATSRELSLATFRAR